MCCTICCFISSNGPASSDRWKYFSAVSLSPMRSFTMPRLKSATGWLGSRASASWNNSSARAVSPWL